MLRQRRGGRTVESQPAASSAQGIEEDEEFILKEPLSSAKDLSKSAFARNWKSACGVCWIIFIFVQWFVYYDRQYSADPLCPHSDKDYGNVYWYINYAVLGGFVITWMSVVTKLIYADPVFEAIPSMININIVSMGTIATMLALLFEWGGVCIDQLK